MLDQTDLIGGMVTGQLREFSVWNAIWLEQLADCAREWLFAR